MVRRPADAGRLRLLVAEVNDDLAAMATLAQALSVSAAGLAAQDCTPERVSWAALDLHRWYTAAESLSYRSS